MATKKSKSNKTMMQKLGNQASHLKDEIITGKNHLAEVVSEAIDSVKVTIQHITQKKKAAAKKSFKAKPKKAKAARKIIAKKAVAKKKATPRKIVKK